MQLGNVFGNVWGARKIVRTLAYIHLWQISVDSDQLASLEVSLCPKARLLYLIEMLTMGYQIYNS